MWNSKLDGTPCALKVYAVWADILVVFNFSEALGHIRPVGSSETKKKSDPAAANYADTQTLEDISSLTPAGLPASALSFRRQTTQALKLRRRWKQQQRFH